MTLEDFMAMQSVDDTRKYRVLNPKGKQYRLDEAIKCGKHEVIGVDEAPDSVSVTIKYMGR